ncbi:DUF490 domain-containing protein [Geomonas terrae]|uniref:DUF490 domain-containing protein n=1 Tax=Geomonas terrae TaxID=2562681 RepID=A0A4S1CCX8_9BACT|nr:translocation/assembly module TamB domain-containing protein [Geomonas terrae]TGU71257.1 DUF490 domain-containing protein [Geomonas terrae]
MKRVALYIAAPAVGLSLLLAGGAAWLVYTSSGARFALVTIAGIGGKASVQKVEGRLRDRLLVKGLRLSRRNLVVEVERLELSWEPEQLFRGELLVHDIGVSSVRIQDDTPLSAKAPDLSWPQPSAILRRLDARVERISVKGVRYRHLQSEPFVLKELAAGMTLKDGLLTLSAGSLSLENGKATGFVEAGLRQPSLRLDLQLAPATPVADLDAVSVKARLVPGRAPEQLAGPVELEGKRGGTRRLEVNAELGVTGTGFNFRSLRLVRPGRPGTLTGNGSMTLTASEPLFALALAADHLDLSKELDRPSVLNGTLSFSGTPSAYAGTFALSNKGTGWENMGLAANYRGGKSGVRLAPLSGNWLEGSVRGALDVDWSRGWKVAGNLSGRGLDPSRLAAEWDGKVNLDITGSIGQAGDGPVSGALQAHLLQSRLKGRELSGELEGGFQGARLAVKRLLLAGRGFRFSGHGEVDRRFDFAADVSDISSLLPGSAGALKTDGWLRWRDGMLSGAAEGTGRNLAAGGATAGAVQLSATLDEGKEHPVKLSGTASALSAAGVRIDTASFALAGTEARHTLEARLASRGATADFLASGGYADGTWRGELARLTGNDGVGPFALAAPAHLVVGNGRFSTTPLVLNGAPGERVELSGSMGRDRSGKLVGVWERLNLARANAWLAGGEVAGESSGNLELALSPAGGLTVTARAEAAGSFAREGKRVAFERLQATLDGGRSGIAAAVDLALEKGGGTARLGFRSDRPARLALPDRGEISLLLTNLDLALLRPFLATETTLDGRLNAEAHGRLLPGGKLDVEGNTALTGGAFKWRDKGDQFDASIDRAGLSFRWLNAAAAGKRGGELVLHGRAEATGEYRSEGEKLIGSQFTIAVDADKSGTKGEAQLWLDTGGSLTAALSSPSPAGTALPETGDVTVQWSGIKPALLRPWLPGALELQGELDGNAKGRLLPGRRLEAAGEALFTQGSATWQGTNGAASAGIRTARFTFDWRGDALTGALDLALAEYGQGKGEFRLPVPARLPVTPDQSGAVSGSFAGKLREHGFLTALFPGLVQESRGLIDADLKVGGVWGDPTVQGTLHLSDAGAYLPSAGITLTGVELSARLEKDMFLIERLRAVSGGGELVGNLKARLAGWEVRDFQGTLSGQRFQTVYLPELTMYTSPQLTFEGTGTRATLAGEIGIPEMLVSGPPVQKTVTPSEDVVFEGALPQAKQAAFPLHLEGRVKVTLGDKVRVEASGIDARLGGSMDLVLNGIDDIQSSGEIKVVEGRYRAYGMDLQIVRGRLYYVNDPVTRPTLDVLALRTVGDVKAGVTVGGSLKTPVVKLYSEPTMPEVDILAYMVLGHPMGESGEQGGMLATAAASLFSLGKSESLQEQIKDRLGLSTIGLERVDTSTTGRMGYKELPTTPGGVKQPTVGESLFTVGKYLTPKLYLSYGRSLITGQNLFRLRYDIFKRLQIETQSGSESGADLYYKMEFN